MSVEPGRLVVVSPHLDDAVLSASLQLSRPGVRLVTVFAGRPAADVPLAWWDRLTRAANAAQRVDERYVEDDGATGELGVVDNVRLTFPDGQHIADPADRVPQDDLVAALQPLLADASEVWAPAGVGSHPDHVATREAAIRAAAPDATVHHYSDVPYSLRYGWPPSVTGRAGSPFLDVDAWLVEETRAAGFDCAALTRTVHVLDADAQRRKVAAMACYATQIPALDYGRVLADGDSDVVGFEVSWSRA